VGKALEAGDYEKAAAHIERYLRIGAQCASFLEEANRVQLQQAQQQLEALVKQRLEEAIRAKNAADIVRFCRLYAPLGKPQEGLQLYLEYLVQLFHTHAEQLYRRLPPPIRGIPLPKENKITGVYIHTHTHTHTITDTGKTQHATRTDECEHQLRPLTQAQRFRPSSPVARLSPSSRTSPARMAPPSPQPLQVSLSLCVCVCVCGAVYRDIFVSIPACLASRPAGSDVHSTIAGYVQALSGTFELYARIVEKYQTEVETYFGEGAVWVFVRELQREVDRYALTTLEQFIEQYDIQKRVQTVRLDLAFGLFRSSDRRGAGGAAEAVRTGGGRRGHGAGRGRGGLPAVG
jgi:hypothetical protein